MSFIDKVNVFHDMKMAVVYMAAVAAIMSVLATSCQTSIGDSRSPGGQQADKRPVPAVVGSGHGKVLVAYFSVPETDGVDASSGASRVVVDGKMVGNTQYVASVISEATGGDLFEIKTTYAYPGSHKALIDAAKKELDDSARPKLATHIGNLRDYDVVFVGFPNWWYDMPMPIYSFFDEYDFSGMTIIPFCTHGGSRFSGAINTIRNLEKQATVFEGYSISRDRVPESKAEVLNWLGRIGMK